MNPKFLKPGEAREVKKLWVNTTKLTEIYDGLHKIKEAIDLLDRSQPSLTRVQWRALERALDTIDGLLDVPG